MTGVSSAKMQSSGRLGKPPHNLAKPNILVFKSGFIVKPSPYQLTLQKSDLNSDYFRKFKIHPIDLTFGPRHPSPEHRGDTPSLLISRDLLRRMSIVIPNYIKIHHLK